MKRRINPMTTSCSGAARILIARYGMNALQVASNRQDAAQKDDTSRFYIGVMDEIDRMPLEVVDAIIRRNRADKICNEPVPQKLFNEVTKHDPAIVEQEATVRVLEEELTKHDPAIVEQEATVRALEEELEKIQ